jgi:mono/diheme cytochrome c family protein
MLPEQRIRAFDRRYGRKDARRGARKLQSVPENPEPDAAERPAQTRHRRHGYKIFPGVVLRLIAATMPILEGRLMHTALKQILVLAVSATGLGASPAMAADAAHGGDLAKRWCASCHLVSGDQKEASADVPSFASIAARSDFSPEKVAYFLLDPHPKMPNFPLNRAEAADISAYIGSLRK